MKLGRAPTTHARLINVLSFLGYQGMECSRAERVDRLRNSPECRRLQSVANTARN